MHEARAFEPLTEFLSRVPAVRGPIGVGSSSDGRWWVKFALDLEHPLVWRVVQELAHLLNYLSVGERLPTIFMPVSPPPALNGGPRDFLSWVIEVQDAKFQPEACAQWLEGRLPEPVDDLASWSDADEEEI